MTTPKRLTWPVKLQLLDPSYEDADGLTYPGDIDAEGTTVWHIHPENCEHKTTVCFTCARDWCEGYIVTADIGTQVVVINDLMAAMTAFAAAASHVLATGTALTDGLVQVGHRFQTALDAISTAVSEAIKKSEKRSE